MRYRGSGRAPRIVPYHRTSNNIAHRVVSAFGVRRGVRSATKVRRSHDGDLISVWKGDRSEPTTLRATASGVSTPSTTPGLKHSKPRRLLATMSRKSFLTSTRPLRVLGEVRHPRGKTSRREAQPAGQLPAVSRPLPRPPACTKASPYKRQTTACTKASPYKRPCKLFP